MKSIIRAVFRLWLSIYYRSFHPRPCARVIPETFIPRRVLVFNGAHIGDVIISTSIIPILRSAYPQAEIGFVTGSWSSMVLKNHSDVAYLHCVDHWLLNRNGKSVLSRICHYRKTLNKALDEIREIRYDLALHIYTWSFPDLLEISWLAGIPIKLCFAKSLLAPLATAVTDLPDNDFKHQSELQAHVLHPLNIGSCHLDHRRSSLPESAAESVLEVCKVLNVSRIQDLSYCIIHMGSGASIRELPLSVWRDVAESLAKSHLVVFTGKGDRETQNAAVVISGLSRCVNACNRLSWDGFVAAVRHAEVVYGVESMAGHVAAAVGTKCVVAYTGMAGVARWRPESPKCTVLTQHVPCAPCGRPHGCKDMTCLLSVSASDFVGNLENRTSNDFLARNSFS